MELTTATLTPHLSHWPGDVVREKAIVEGQTFLIDRPDDSLKVAVAPPPGIDAPKDFLPFWTELWPAGRMLAKILITEPLTPGQEALEIGCGLGLPGIVALSRGLRVVFSDYDANAVRFAGRNALLNGLDQFHLLQLDWHNPPPRLSASLILGSDLIYQANMIEPLVKLIKKVLLPGGSCLITDQERVPAAAFQACLQGEGFRFSTKSVRAGEPGGRRHKGLLYRITH